MLVVVAMSTHSMILSSSSSSSSSHSFLSETLISQTPQTSITSFPPTSFHTHHSFPILNYFNGRRQSSSYVFKSRYTDRILVRGSKSACVDHLSPIGMLLSLLEEFGLDEKESEVILVKNPRLKITSLDDIRMRMLSLQSLGIVEFALYRLITKCPDVLTSIEVGLLIAFVQVDLDSKIEAAQLERLLTSTEPGFLLGFDEKVKLLLRHGIPRDKLAHVLNNVNLAKAFSFNSYEEIERKLAYLDRFDGAYIIVRRPMILHFDLDTQLIPKIEFLTELNGGDEVLTGTVLRKLPAILSYSLEHITGHAELLRSFAGFTDDEIFKIILVFPNVISASKTRKLYPRIEFLKECGLNSSELFKFLCKAPLFLGLSFEDNISLKLSFLVKMGFEYRTKELTVALGAVTRTSCDNLQKVVGLFLDYGLSCEEIHVMTKKHSQILQYKYSSLEEKMDYLIDEMGREVDELVFFPAFLGYNLDERIKCRYEVKKKTRGEGMSINKLLSVSTERFSKRPSKKKTVHLVDSSSGNDE